MGNIPCLDNTFLGIAEHFWRDKKHWVRRTMLWGFEWAYHVNCHLIIDFVEFFIWNWAFLQSMLFTKKLLKDSAKGWLYVRLDSVDTWILYCDIVPCHTAICIDIFFYVKTCCGSPYYLLAWSQSMWLFFPDFKNVMTLVLLKTF